MTEKAALRRYEKQNLQIIKDLYTLKQEIKRLEQEEKKLHEVLEQGFLHYGLVQCKPKDIPITLTWVPESTGATIDLKKLEAEEPDTYGELLEDYPKETIRKGYLRITTR